MNPTISSSKILLLGGSRNIGYLTGLRLLAKGYTITYLLRNPKTFDKDEKIQQYVQSGRARLVQGDATSEHDMARAWTEAGRGGYIEGQVHFVLSSVGTLPKISITKGIAMETPDICARAIRVMLLTMPEPLRAEGMRPRIAALSSTGLGDAGVAALPGLHRMFYPTILKAPHNDKQGMEIVLSRVSGHSGGEWVAPSERVPETILPVGWEREPTLPAPGSLPETVIIRPAWLVDSPVSGQYRVIPGFGDRQCKTIAREDVAHFIAEQLVPNWDKFAGKAVSLGY